MCEKKTIEARWRRLWAAHKADLPALTIATARELVRDCPDCGPAWKILGEALVEMARHTDAEQALKQAISLCPPDKVWIPLCQMGHLHRASGDYKAAAAWYRRAIDRMPDEASGHIHLGGVLARSGRLKEAEMAHRAAIRCTHGRRDEAYLNLGLVLRAQERHDEAAICFEQALKLDPNYAEAQKALRDMRKTMRFSKQLRTDATLPTPCSRTAELHSGSPSADLAAL
jgi:tetratricopeptide (TPR) repeat protein